MDAPMCRARRLAAGHDWLLTISQVTACGLTKYDLDCELRARRWHAVQRGVYVIDADIYRAGLPQRAGWRAALLAQGAGGLLVATTAMRAFGVQGLAMREDVIEVGTVGGLSRRQRSLELPGVVDVDCMPRVVVRQLDVSPEEFRYVDGLPVREIGLSLVDATLNADRATALAVLDSSLHLGLLSRDELLEAVTGARGRRGVVTLRWLAERADGRAESPVESRVRLPCLDADLAPDDLQYPVRDSAGHLIAVGDLAWHKGRRRALLAEADGTSVHSLPNPVFRDRWRGNALAAQACDTVRFTTADSYRPRYIEYLIRSALAAAL